MRILLMSRSRVERRGNWPDSWLLGPSPAAESRRLSVTLAVTAGWQRTCTLWNKVVKCAVDYGLYWTIDYRHAPLRPK